MKVLIKECKWYPVCPMKRFLEQNIEPGMIEEIFISHAHWDHTGGLSDLLKINPVKVYVPSSCPEPLGAREVIKIKEPLKIHENIFSTGELDDIEQSLVINTQKGSIVIVGCAHPGVKAILEKVSQHGPPRVLIGDLHGFSDLDLLNNMELVCPTHCTQFQSEIKFLYPQKYLTGGVGRVVEINGYHYYSS